MFLDASAIIAILGQEPEEGYFIGKIETSRRQIFYSAIAVYEAVLGLARKKRDASLGIQVSIPADFIEEARLAVEGFLAEIGAREIAIAAGVQKIALDASIKFGTVTGHPARLNMGDCFAYACATAYQMPLLYKGNDFPHTDIERA